MIIRERVARPRDIRSRHAAARRATVEADQNTSVDAISSTTIDVATPGNADTSIGVCQ